MYLIVYLLQFVFANELLINAVIKDVSVSSEGGDQSFA